MSSALCSCAIVTKIGMVDTMQEGMCHYTVNCMRKLDAGAVSVWLLQTSNKHRHLYVMRSCRNKLLKVDHMSSKNILYSTTCTLYWKYGG